MSDRALNTSYSGSMYNQEMKPLDYLYGPWESIEQMLNELNVHINEIEPGLTVGVIEDNKVVEYWNPIVSMGFIKKTTGGNVHDKVDTYSEALEYATIDNVGNYIYVSNEEDVDGKSYASGLYLVADEGQLLLLSSNLWYGIFPESEQMQEDEILHVNHDGAARLSEVYRIFKIEQLKNRKNLAHLNSHIHWMVEDLDTEETEDEHVYISKVENTHGKISLSHKDLDTSNILMSGHDEDNEETFITVVGANVGNYKNGDVIKKGDTMTNVIRNLLVNESHPTKYELPTITLNGIEDKTILEVGEKLATVLNITYTDGKIQTYEGAENLDEGIMIDADCRHDSPIYSLKENDSEFETISSVIDQVMTEGTYTFKGSVNYSKNLVIPKTNFDNIEHDLFIPAGSTSDEKTIEVKYKIWSVQKEDVDRNLVVEVGDYLNPDNIIEYGEPMWLNRNETCIDIIKLKKGEGYYILCPFDCYVLYDTPIAVDVKPVMGGVYKHVLPNGDEIDYILYYMLNTGTYFNVRIMSDEKIEIELPEIEE